MLKLVKYVIADILRSRIILAYTALLLVMAMSVFNLEDNTAKGLLSMLNVVLVIVPLVSIIYASIYVYNSTGFIELLVSQPIARKSIWRSLFAGVSGSLVISFSCGMGIPILIYSPDATGFFLVATGILLSIIFAGLGVMGSVKIRDKSKGIGLAILMWLYFTVIFDGLVLFATFQLADYPLEKPMVFVSAFNPIDLSRILVLLRMDVSALMGYTGAVFMQYFGTFSGMCISFAILVLWSVGPYFLSERWFVRKDL